MKKLFFGILIFFGLVMAISYGISLFPTFTISGKEFLVYAANKDYGEAYSMLTDEMQNQHSLEAFSLSLKETGLDKYETVDWVKTFVDKNKGTASILGIVTTSDGKKIPVQIRFMRVTGPDWTDQAWRITEVRTHASANEGLY